MLSIILASCQSPGDIDHGVKIGSDYGHGKTVQYVCDAEYTLEGQKTLTCNDGKWNFDPPLCKGKYVCLFVCLFNQQHCIS